MHVTSQSGKRAPVLQRRAATWRRRIVAVDERTNVTAFETGRAEPGAPVLVLVHGLGQWTQAAWDFVAGELEETHRLIGLDLPGFGDSSKPGGDYTLRTFGRALDAVVDAFALEAFALAGHSLGGLVAADFAARRPRNVRALALLAPVGFLRSAKIGLRIAAGGYIAERFTTIRPPKALVRRTFEIGVYDPASIPAAYHARAYALSQDPALTQAFALVYAGAREEFVHFRELHARLARWVGPTLLLWGQQDRYVPVRAMRNARRVYPGAHCVVIERCGHCPNLEYPATVAQALRELGA